MRTIPPKISPMPTSRAALSILTLVLCLFSPFAAIGETSERATASKSSAETSPSATEPSELSETTADPELPADLAETADSEATLSAGLWIYLDPETGEQIDSPSPELTARKRAWAASLNKSDEGLEAFELEQGGRGIHLKGRFRHALKATLLPDGSFDFRCSDHPHELLSNQAPAHAATTIPSAPEQ